MKEQDTLYAALYCGLLEAAHNMDGDIKDISWFMRNWQSQKERLIKPELQKAA